MDYRLIVGDGFQLHFCRIHLYGDGLFHSEIARQGGQLHHLERAVGSFEAELPGLIRGGYFDGSFFGELGGFCIK